ncbi:MAG TPA: permease prefix domain 1-containing protein [Candidatus Limnocylindria bacterium]
MADHDLVTAYLEALHERLVLPDDERAAAIEEIEAHIEESVSAAAQHGVEREAAERRALERLGAPDRLASDITDAHRLPGHALAAAGTALRVGVKTGIGAYILAWAGILAVALAFGLVLAGLRTIFGPALLEADFSAATDGLMPAVVAAIVALALGNALVEPVAITARRSVGAVRAALIAVGVPIVAFVVLTMVTARWDSWSAVLMASAPVWYALGVARSKRLPIPRVSFRLVLLTAIAFIVGSMALLGAAGGAGSVETFEDVGEPFDPNVRYAVIGRFVDLEHPPVEMDFADSSTGPFQGPGPVPLVRTGTIKASAAGDWTGLRLEVWPGPEGQLNGDALDPNATEPLAVAAMERTDRRLSALLTFGPLPSRQFYYVAVTGIGADGVRMQLAWPDVVMWEWRGTVAQWFASTLR